MSKVGVHTRGTACALSGASTHPRGPEGDVVFRQEQRTTSLQLTDESLPQRHPVPRRGRRPSRLLRLERLGRAWHARHRGRVWPDPRQEYEAMGIMNCGSCTPSGCGTDPRGPCRRSTAIIDIGARGRREIGTKVNMLHIWALATRPELRPRHRARAQPARPRLQGRPRSRDCFGVVRRLYKGLWGDGPMLDVDARLPRAGPRGIRPGSSVSSADRSARRSPRAAAFQRFNGATELLGFLLHFDNRLGLGDHGPYPTEDGGF